MRNPTRTMAAVVLIFEAMLVVFAALVAKDLSSLSTGWALGGGAALAAALIVTAGLLRSTIGYVIGSLLQVALLATALVVPAMVIVGVIFAGLWVAALLIGRHVTPTAAAPEQTGYAPQP